MEYLNYKKKLKIHIKYKFRDDDDFLPIFYLLNFFLGETCLRL